MSIESEQDKKNYKETSKTSGLSVSYTPGSAVTVSGGKGKTNTDSTYESVTKQAGIYAGKEGYDIQVKNNTHLKGGIIDSKAPAEKNKLTTGTLTWENIDNKAEYKTSGKGISYSTGAGIPLNALGLLSNMDPTVKDKEGTTTKSAVAKGTITITDKENRKQNISAAFGGILSKMTGGSGHTGAYISQMGTKWNEYLLTQLERSEEELWEQKEKEREQYPGNGAYSKEEIEDAIEKGVIKEKDYFMNLANAYPGGAGIALEMSAMSDYEIQQKYGNQMTLIEGRTYVINQKSPFADTIMHSINYTNALGDAISRVRASGIRDQYVDFTVDIRSDSKTNEIFDNSSFLLAGTYSGNISVMIDSKGVIHERSCFIDNYNFERHKLPNSYGFGKIMELNNAAALSMQAGKLKPFMWILYVHRTFSRFGESNEE